jgi:hypothetical protein
MRASEPKYLRATKYKTHRYGMRDRYLLNFHDFSRPFKHALNISRTYATGIRTHKTLRFTYPLPDTIGPDVMQTQVLRLRHSRGGTRMVEIQLISS